MAPRQHGRTNGTNNWMVVMKNTWRVAAKLAVAVCLWVASVTLAVAASPDSQSADALWPQREDSSPPNIVFVMADDLGWADVGFHGGNAPTPRLDRLAHKSLELRQHYVAPVCSPTRTGFLTGRNQVHKRSRNAAAGQEKDAMSGSAPSNRVRLNRRQTLGCNVDYRGLGIFPGPPASGLTVGKQN